MNKKKIEKEATKAILLVDQGRFEEALSTITAVHTKIKKCHKHDRFYYTILFNVACVLVDLGSMMPHIEAAETGSKVLEDNEQHLIRLFGKANYYYNLGNAKGNLIPKENPFDRTFETIEALVDLKNNFWKAIHCTDKTAQARIPEHVVNLANALKQQFRIVEALQCYDEVNRLNLDIPQAWSNRSETLLMLNTVSTSLSIQMLEQTKLGYVNTLKSAQIPPQWRLQYEQYVEWLSTEIDRAMATLGIEADDHDEAKTQQEYDNQSAYRKFCLTHHLTLSEHGLYCPCVGSARDDLTIPTTTGVGGDYIVPMEMVLNRLKSEFSFARKLYFDYLHYDEDYDLLHESCFSELFDNEVVGVDVEKLRTAFRVCFGILDKIGVAICELYDLYPKSGMVSFQSFWQLDKGDRRTKFNQVKNPGLLALYSIATDLNERKDGEWAFLKKWRNVLEHAFLVIHRSDSPAATYDSFKYIKDIAFAKEDEFIRHLKQLLTITRSAIFSFVFMVRDKSLQEYDGEGSQHLTLNMLKKDFIDW